MKGKGKARSQGRRGRTDCRRTRKPEIPNMDISPVINVSREKRGNHTEPVHRRHLVSAEQLGVNHHRPDFYRPQSPQNPLKGGDELIRRRIAVAVSQQLPVFRQCVPDKASTASSE